MTETDVDPLRHAVARFYDQEREERNERRGLEQRAATTMGGVLVALSLILNMAASEDVHLDSKAGVLIVSGLLLATLGMLVLTYALSGAHATPNLSVWQALRRPGQARVRVVREPQPLTEVYLTELRDRVSRLADRHARLVPILRAASLVLGAAVYLALAGAAFQLLK